MNNNPIIKAVEAFTKTPPTLDNMEDMISLKGFMPIQSNTNIDDETKQISWAQLIVTFKNEYGRIDDITGESIQDNATHKKLVIKFPKRYLENHSISANEFKSFFDNNFVKKSRLVLPVSDERQSFDNKLPIKNQSEVTIANSFDLRGFIDSYSAKAK
jgi:hypothetical protein